MKTLTTPSAVYVKAAALALGLLAAPVSVYAGDCGPTQSQNTSLEIVDLTGVACAADGITTENGFARSFDISGSYTVCTVETGIETNSGPSDICAAINVYQDTNGGDPTNPDSDLELLGSQEFNIPGGFSGIIQVTFNEPVEVPSGPMVVEMLVEPGVDGGVFPGANEQGESAPSFLRAADCDLADFATYASIGFPEVNFVLTVNGDTFDSPGVACSVGDCPAVCDGDVNGDGSVDGADLGLLLGAFGDCPAEGSCCADINTSGNVDGADLGLLLGAFGECPGGGGDPEACCFSDGTCQDLTPTECQDMGGVNQGVGTSCGAGDCEAAECPPGADGDCCVANGTPGCENVECCDTVCSADSFCCDTEWDQLCADQAVDLCGDLCGPGGDTEACCFTDGTCQDLSIAACQDMGGANQGVGTSCAGGGCEGEKCPPDADGDCCSANGTPGCSDVECCDAVCSIDAFCCNTSWDAICVGEADELCLICSDEPFCGDGQCNGDEDADSCPEDCAVSECPGKGNCCEANGSPGCNDEDCCNMVCISDDFCCEVEWDSACAGLAGDLCSDLCGP